MRILVTGGCGFIGSAFIRMVLKEHPDVSVANIDALTYAANQGNLEGIAQGPRYRFVHGDIRNKADVAQAMDGCTHVVNFAAETHVDRSLDSPELFEEVNACGTAVLLAEASRRKIQRFLQISTDEVYGTLGPYDHPFTEDLPPRPSSPYSASKAAADLMAIAFRRSFDLPVVITRCSNNYGPRQDPEKLIPFFISRLMEGKDLPLYGDGMQVRDWIHVDDHCRGVWLALTKGQDGRIYNLGATCEKRNIEIAHALLKSFGLGDVRIAHVRDRPGHDRRYAMDSSRARDELGFEPQVAFSSGIARTVEWYRSNQDWMEKARGRLASFGLSRQQQGI